LYSPVSRCVYVVVGCRQNVARATYREILERRAKENSVDFVEGVATAITPMALLETVMVKGYETVVDPDTKIDLKTAMLAACRLQEMIDSRLPSADRFSTIPELQSRSGHQPPPQCAPASIG
jgi:hypothetical protein